MSEPLTIQQRFEKFDTENPHVYDEIVRRAQALYENGESRIGMKAIFESIRYDSAIRTIGADFKLSNEFTSRYTRKLVNEHPHFSTLFVMHQLKAA